MEILLGSIYSGAIDGFALAAKKSSIRTVWHIEVERKAHKYLKWNYGENIKIHGFDEYCGTKNLEWCHIIAGGDPCQPHSYAGNRGGAQDHRYRWPQMFRIIRELHPDWVINENVAGSVSNLVLDQKIADLESQGYTCQAFNIPAIACNAHHQRQRIWLVAHTDVQRRRELLHFNPQSIYQEREKEYSLGAQGNAFLQFEQRFSEPPIFSFPNGVPDRLFRLGAAGNSIVHQIPLIILTGIKWIYENY